MPACCRVHVVEQVLGEYNNLKKLNDFLEGREICCFRCVFQIDLMVKKCQTWVKNLLALLKLNCKRDQDMLTSLTLEVQTLCWIT